MPEKKTTERARRARSKGQAPSTQAGEFVREEIHHVREGKHGARSPKQAIAVGLSKARRAGVDLPPPKRGQASEKTRKNAERAYERGQGAPPRARSSKKRSRAAAGALQREPRGSVTQPALARQGRQAAAKRSPSSRSAAARKGARTKSAAARSGAAKGGARTRKKRRSPRA